MWTVLGRTSLVLRRISGERQAAFVFRGSWTSSWWCKGNSNPGTAPSKLLYLIESYLSLGSRDKCVRGACGGVGTFLASPQSCSSHCVLGACSCLFATVPTYCLTRVSRIEQRKPCLSQGRARNHIGSSRDPQCERRLRRLPTFHSVSVIHPYMPLQTDRDMQGYIDWSRTSMEDISPASSTSSVSSSPGTYASTYLRRRIRPDVTGYTKTYLITRYSYL
jgi:hypothetical protein